MKTLITCWAMVLLGTVSMHAQDGIPPAFESPTGPPSSGDGNAAMHDPFDPLLHAPKFVRVQIEWIEIGHQDLTKLLIEDTPKTSDATPLRRKLQAMTEKGTAKIIDTQVCNARSGERSTSESIHELIYATEYKPINLADPGEVDKAHKEVTPPKEASIPSSPTYLPTAFEVRNIGSMLDIEPNIDSDAHAIDLRLETELSRHAGFHTYLDGKDALGNDMKVKMPKIYLARIRTAVTCISGQYTLLGILSPQDDAGNTDPDHKLLVFVKCHILSAAQ